MAIRIFLVTASFTVFNGDMELYNAPLSVLVKREENDPQGAMERGLAHFIEQETQSEDDHLTKDDFDNLQCELLTDVEVIE